MLLSTNANTNLIFQFTLGTFTDVRKLSLTCIVLENDTVRQCLINDIRAQDYCKFKKIKNAETGTLPMHEMGLKWAETRGH